MLAALAAALLICAAPLAATSVSEDHAQRYYRLGQAQFEQGNTKQAIESLEKALSLNRKLAEAHNFLGLIYLQQSDPQRSADHFKKAVEINGYFTDARNHLGVAYKELRKYDKAMKQFRIALKDKTYRTPEKIHLNMGHLFLERGRFPDAIKEFSQAVSLNPGYLRGILGLGITYKRSGKPDLAERELRKVLRLGPGTPEAAEARQALDGQVKQEGS